MLSVVPRLQVTFSCLFVTPRVVCIFYLYPSPWTSRGAEGGECEVCCRERARFYLRRSSVPTLQPSHRHRALCHASFPNPYLSHLSPLNPPHQSPRSGALQLGYKEFRALTTWASTYTHSFPSNTTDVSTCDTCDGRRYQPAEITARSGSSPHAKQPRYLTRTTAK